MPTPDLATLGILLTLNFVLGVAAFYLADRTRRQHAELSVMVLRLTQVTERFASLIQNQRALHTSERT